MNDQRSVSRKWRAHVYVRNERRAAFLFLSQVADNVKHYRLKKGWTRRDLATACGLTQSYVVRVERGIENVMVMDLERLAGGLGCTSRDLVASDKPWVRKRYGFISSTT